MRLPRSRLLYVTLTITALAAVLLANAHLVYIASTSQPDCVAHTRGDANGKAPGVFGAAKSSC